MERTTGESHKTELSRELVFEVLRKYGEAWRTKNCSMIAALFTKDAIYHEQVLSQPIKGRKNIYKYWHMRVVRGQENITFNILQFYIDGNVVIAEWEARFDVVARRERRLMREVAIIEFRGRHICSLREYWASKLISRTGERRRFGRRPPRAGRVAGGQTPR
jgi:ketosteroid isomerase-like protein